jgi:hypothetical protein
LQTDFNANQQFKIKQAKTKKKKENEKRCRRRRTQELVPQLLQAIPHTASPPFSAPQVEQVH